MLTSAKIGKENGATRIRKPEPGYPWAYRAGRGGIEGGGSPPPPVCWANKASRAIFASQSGGQYWLIIKINGTNSVNFVRNSVNFVGNMLSNRNFP